VSQSDRFLVMRLPLAEGDGQLKPLTAEGYA
jgi:hypothetical protein